MTAAVDLTASPDNVKTLNGPANGAETVNKSDTVNLTNISRGLYVGGTGDVAVVMKDGTTVTYVAVQAGTTLPIRISRVNSTNTTATSMVSMY